ncbi:MAG: hypothetical protein ACKO8Q_10200 [Bacteroidota bacterium]
MKTVLIGLFSLSTAVVFSQADLSKVTWVGKKNLIVNPGGESISGNFPSSWKTDFPDSGESDFWSTYGVTSHEWSSNEKIIGLPANAGNNYFRIMVNRTEEKRESNLYQIIKIDDLLIQANGAELTAVMSGNIAANYYSKGNCATVELKISFLNSDDVVLDSLIVKKKSQEFRDLDEKSELSIERGFSVMHEFIPVQESRVISKGTKKIKVEMYCLFPCNWSQESEHEEDNFNVFFFDNLSLGVYKK